MIDTTFEEPVWMEPVPGKTFNGNVCIPCIRILNRTEEYR
jgi:hypothetical protein